MAEMNIYEKLRKVQLELKVPKSQRNNFGNYNYRSAEDIVEAAKPVLNKHGLVLVLSDQLQQVGDRYYVMATAMVMDSTKEGQIEATAFAREDEIKKGMDGSQITGAASSYARKYALNGLFAIDDTKDADSNEHRAQTAHVQAPPSKPAIGSGTSRSYPEEPEMATPIQKKQITAFMRAQGVEDNDIATRLITDFGLDPKKLTKADAAMVLKELQ